LVVVESARVYARIYRRDVGARYMLDVVKGWVLGSEKVGRTEEGEGKICAVDCVGCVGGERVQWSVCFGGVAWRWWGCGGRG
jgi:hypothetical protein